ncbi:MAG: Dual-specificity RNA methyltransferase RlmN [Syntrophorhabdaceae bacterium PtaU1.Bin034]|nr:MAG: Dual-specificity RNA methyltransferase RlmN [Syntrophorhabdaceae bacterium PtaU1.Bin034]
MSDAAPPRRVVQHTMTNFFDLTLAELEDILESMGLKPYRARQVYKWVYQMDTADFDLMTNLPKSLRVTLKKMFHFGLPHITETHGSRDGSTKYVFTTHDGHVIESVFMPENGRSTVCLSTQVGCKMSCAFCVTGRIGFIRDLTPAEIVGQVMAIKPHMGEDRITNIVLMGMGEPVDNIDNVLKAIDILEEPLGLKISHRRLTVSTVGLIDGMRQIGPKKAQLAISLNASTGAVRTRLMPINRVYPLHDVVGYVKSLGNMGRIRVTFEYVMLKDVNDSLDDAKTLVQLLKGVKCKINLIPYNESPYSEFKSPDPEAVKQFQSYLIERHFTAIVRDSRASDIGGGCGQLGMKYLEERGR